MPAPEPPLRRPTGPPGFYARTLDPLPAWAGEAESARGAPPRALGPGGGIPGSGFRVRLRGLSPEEQRAWTGSVATPSPARLPPSGEATDEPPWSEVVVELPLPPPALGAGAGSSLEPGDGLVAEAIQAAVRNYVHDPPRVVAGLHRPFVVGAKTLVMGVVNVTPDSFSDGGEFLEAEAAFSHGLRLVDEGADLLDIGGESTRPGASDVSPEAEWARVGPVIARLHGTVSVPISVDTRHAEVAARALDAGADLVNDVSGLRDAEMRRVVARSGAPAIAMHMRGTPATMQANLAYRDVVGEVYDSLVDAARSAVSDGIAAEQLLIDPGLGFGKSAGQNLELLGRLAEFRSMGFPVVVGASRKSFLGWVVGKAPLGDRLEAGLAAAVLAARARAHVVRTHDVAPTVRVLALADAVVGRTRPAPPR